MYCCLVKIDCYEKNIPEYVIEQLKETMKLYFDSTDKFTYISRKILFLTSVEKYSEVKEKLIGIQENFEKKHGSSIKLTCGFAELKNGDLWSAIDGARQMLEHTTGINPISGMYYYRVRRL